MLPESAVYVLIPIVSALIGWLTNFLAVKMIFRPRRAVNIAGLRIQGLVPRRQTDLARKIGETVESRLLTHDDIHAALSSPQTHEAAGRLIEEQVDVFFKQKLAANPMVAMFLQGDAALQIKRALVAQLQDAVPRFLESLLERSQGQLDLKAIVQRKIEEFDVTTLEAIVFQIASRELRWIVVLGGALGFLVGLGQVALLLLMDPGVAQS